MLSIIIVSYLVEAELLRCIESIALSKQKIEFEIIVVDNDEKKTLGKKLKKLNHYVKYIKAAGNIGYAAGNNLGARYSKGDYLFFLNPDTRLVSGSLDDLITFFSKKNVGIVAPLLLGLDGKAYQQGSLELSPIRAIFSLSFFSKLFRNNPISRKYLMLGWARKRIKEVGVSPGTAFMIRKSVFEKIGGFDENFFLYFEEFDLCRRVRKLGYRIYINPEIKMIHEWGSSTKKSNLNIKKIFEASRFYYFRKHFGLLQALVTEGIIRFNKNLAIILFTLLVGFFLRSHKIADTMAFIGDQGWFYLSARDFLQTGQIPLVGIASSHPWLHQGTFWTYLLALGLYVFNYNPISGAYISIAIDLIGIIAIFKLGSEFFSKRFGVIASILYATSPLIIQNSRMPYHTSAIPLFTIVLIYCLYKWINGSKYYFPLLIGVLGILYNFGLSTILFPFIVLFILSYGFVTKKNWATGIVNSKIIIISTLSFIFTMLPVLIYDFQNGFPQTVRFMMWIGYKLLVLIGYPPLNLSGSVSMQTMMNFFIEKYSELIYPFSDSVSLVIFVGSVAYLIAKLRFKKGNIALLTIINLMLITGVFLLKTPSDAYLPMLFPGIILLEALFFNSIFESKKFKELIVPFFFLVLLFNCLFVVYKIYVIDENRFTNRINVTKVVVNESKGQNYNIIGRGIGSQFKSFTMNYEYLAWWMGHGPSNKNEILKFYISEDNGKILIDRKIYK